MASAVIKLTVIFMVIEIIAADSGDQVISRSCLRCICQAKSGCQLDLKCDGEVCGLFGITKPFWIDAGSFTLHGRSDDADDDDYQKCTTDPSCATKTVKAYMKRFRQDCNDDGKIDCQDYMAIYMKGGYECHGKVPVLFEKKFNKCLAEKNTNKNKKKRKQPS